MYVQSNYMYYPKIINILIDFKKKRLKLEKKKLMNLIQLLEFLDF